MVRHLTTLLVCFSVTTAFIGSSLHNDVAEVGSPTYKLHDHSDHCTEVGSHCTAIHNFKRVHSIKPVTIGLVANDRLSLAIRHVFTARRARFIERAGARAPPLV